MRNEKFNLGTKTTPFTKNFKYEDARTLKEQGISRRLKKLEVKKHNTFMPYFS